MSEGQEKKTGVVGKGCLVLVAGFLGIGVLGTIFGDAPKDSASRNNSQPISSETSGDQDDRSEGDEEEAGTAAKWTYHESRDELRDATTYTARLRSENAHDFGFPYGNGNYLTAVIRQSPAYGKDVYFEIDSGQMLCDIYDCRYSVAFDGREEGLTLVPPEDHNSEVLFSKYPEAIIKKIRGSDRMVVEIGFYQNGNRQFIFDTKGLEWDH